MVKAAFPPGLTTGLLCSSLLALAGCDGPTTWTTQPGPGPLDLGTPLVTDSGDMLFASRNVWGDYDELHGTLPVLLALGPDGVEHAYHEAQGFSWFDAWPTKSGDYVFAGGWPKDTIATTAFRVGRMSAEAEVIEEHSVAWPDDAATKYGNVLSQRVSIRVNDAGEAFIVGHGASIPIADESYAFVYKFDKKGDLVYSWALDAPNQSMVSSFDLRPDGGIVLAGSAEPKDHGDWIPYFADLDAQGNPKVLQDIFEAEYGPAVRALADGGSLVAYRIVGDAGHTFAAKLDAKGTQAWKWDVTGNAKMSAIAIGKDGTIAVAGTFIQADFGFGSVSADHMEGDLFVAKLDAGGAPLAATHFGNTQVTRISPAVGAEGQVILSLGWDSASWQSEVTNANDSGSIAGMGFDVRGHGMDSMVVRVDP